MFRMRNNGLMVLTYRVFPQVLRHTHMAGGR